MKLEELVENFRRAIECAIDNNEESEYFRKFPVGQCGTTSYMLCQYLINNGVQDIDYVCGTYYPDNWEEWQSHAWLMVNNTVIDITADQFEHKRPPLQCNKPVYIGPLSDFYRLFEVHPGQRHRHFGLQPQWSNYCQLKKDFATILRYL